MDFSRVNFVPLQMGGDDVTAALRKLDLNFGDLGATMGDYPGVVQRLASAERSISALGNASTRNIGSVAGTVAAGDDNRLVFGGYRNRLINPSFDIWQRGTASFATGYTADRWLTSNSGISYRADRVPIDTGLSASRYGIRHSIVSAAGASNYAVMQQRMEGVSATAGRTLTVSFLASSSVQGKRIGVNLEQNFGDGGSLTIQMQGKPVSLTGSLQRYTLRFDVPSIAGKVVGSDGTDFLEMLIWLDAGSNFDFRSGNIGQQSALVYITDVEVKEGDVDTKFERRPDALELSLCQRYFEKSFATDIAPSLGQGGEVMVAGVGWAPGDARFSSVGFKVTKRSVPVITLYPPVNGSVQKVGVWALFNGSIYNSANVTDVLAASPWGFYGNLHFGSGIVATGAYIVAGHYTADAEL